MLGRNTNWVRNVRAAQGRVVPRHRRRNAVRLAEVDPRARGPILRRYLALAPGARAHIPVDRRAPLEDFDRIAAQFSVFHITADEPEPRDTPRVDGETSDADRPTGPIPGRRHRRLCHRHAGRGPLVGYPCGVNRSFMAAAR
jgi:hypothetical protein